jgi:hypothetical protein
MENKRAYKAKQLRHKRAALALIQRDRLCDELLNISTECSELEWAVDDDETLFDVFDGDTDEIHEIRMMFSDLSNNCEKLEYQLRDEYVTEHFDDFFVGSLGSAYHMVGYDSMEEDYFNLTRYDAEAAQRVSGKRLKGLTKETLISVAGQCFGIMMCFLDIRHNYDCLKAVFELLRDERAELISNVSTVEYMYIKTQDDPYNYKIDITYESLLSRLPDRVWVE